MTAKKTANRIKNQDRKPLRIGIDARLAFRRGVGTYVGNLAIALSKIDRRNEYFLFNAPDALKRRVANLRFHWLDLPISNPAYYEQVLLPRAAREKGLSFLHYIDNSGTTTGDHPFVLTLHDTFHRRPLSQVRPKATLWQRLVHAYKKWAVPRSAEKAKAVLTVSDYSKSRIVQEMGVPSQKIFVTPEGVDLGIFKRTVRKPSKLFKILVHGAADERKNLLYILVAAKMLAVQKKEFQLVVIGMDEAELKCTDYLELAANLGLENYVEWAGNVPAWALNQAYADTDLFLYPSLLEGFGLPVLEAFACGVPVITSNTTSLPEVAGSAAALVDPESPQAIARAVKTMMEKPGLRKLYVQRGLRRAKLFSWERTAKLTLQVYERLGA